MGYEQLTEEIFNKSKGCINGETKSYAQFKRELKPFLNDTGYLPVQVGLILQIKKQYWYCVVTKTAFGYDYYIPKDRKDEERLKRETGYYDN